MTRLLPFTDREATRIELAGGKGANLALLTQAGFAVPRGFVVTTLHYREFIAAAGDLLSSFAGTPSHQSQQAQGGAVRLRDALAEIPLPQSLQEQLPMALRDHSASSAFSVRSSSNMEDLAGAAFAGQHDTFLNVSGATAILERIKACFISLWGDRAVAYRVQHGYDHNEASMAVVVQEMAFADISGVAFTVNPVSGDLGEIVIEANFGLGESVVSGECAVDHLEVDKATGTIRRHSISEKTRMCAPAQSGTMELTVPAAMAGRPCLEEGDVAALTGLCRQVESHYGFPQDIEWCRAEDRIWLLQSRPITTIPPRWTRDESAERFPNAISALTWDFVEKGFHESLEHSLRLMKYPPCPAKWFAKVGHHIYGNQNAVVLYAGRAPLKFDSCDDLLLQIPRLREEFRWVQELPVTWMRDLDTYLMRLGCLASTPLGQLSDPELWAHVECVVAHGVNYFRPNIAISITHSALCRILLKLLGLVMPANEARPAFDALLASTETKTSQINRELFELAGIIIRDPQLHERFCARSSQQILAQGMLEVCPEFRDALAAFMENHGHCETDFDALHPPWRDAPWVVLDQIRLIVNSPPVQTPAQREREVKSAAQKTEHRLYARLPEELHFFFQELLRLARVYTSLDDLEHYETTRLNQPLRRALRELGTRLVNQGVLQDPMDIFHLHRDQIHAAIMAATPAAWRTLSDQAIEQKAAYLADAARDPAWILGEDSAPAEFSDSLHGLPGSPGVAEGEVYHVHSAKDFAQFPKGAILLTRTTSPSWTPLFYIARAVVTASGGLLSHGAVTAREMRIPAVMAVRDCLSRFKNGQRIRVDGTHGRVCAL